MWMLTRAQSPPRRSLPNRLPLAALPILAWMLPGGALGATPAQQGYQLPLPLAAPGETVAYFEAREPVQLVQDFLGHPWVAELLTGDELLGRIEDPDFRELLGQLDEHYSGGLAALTQDLAGREAALALALEEGAKSPSFWVALRSPDAERSERALEFVLEQVISASDLPPALFQPKTLEPGLEIVRFGRRFAIGRRGADLLLSNDPDQVELSLLALEDRTDPGLLGVNSFQTTMEQLGAAPLRGWVDLATFESRAPRDFVQWSRARRDPGALVVLGTSLLGVSGAKSLGFGFDLSGAHARAALRIEEPSMDLANLRPTAPAPPSPFLANARNALSATLHRDFAALIENRGDLLEPEQLANFSANLTEVAILFAGVDLEADLLPHIGPWIDVIVRPLEASELGTDPTPRLAALAASVQLEDPLRTGPILESAFQTAVALAAADRAERGERGYLLRLGNEAGQPFTFAELPALPAGEPRGVDYNLVPSLAVVGDRLILSTNVALLRELLAEGLEAPSAQPETSLATEHLTLSGAALRELVLSQMETWAELGALQTGQSRGQLERTITSWTRRLDTARLEITTLQTEGENRVELSLEGWK